MACIERIRQEGYKVPRTSIYDGLKEVRWAGRLQVVGQSPVILLDGAHSPTSAEALCKAIREVFCYRRLILVVGLMRDKDLQAIGQVLCPLGDEIITTQAFDNPRVTPAEEIAEVWSDIGANFHVCPNVREAVSLAQSIATTSDLICIAGSIYIVGEAMKVLGIDEI